MASYPRTPRKPSANLLDDSNDAAPMPSAALLDDTNDAAANMPPVVVPPRVEPLSPSLQGKAAEIEADRARMYGRNAPALQAAGITPGQVNPNQRNVPPAPPAPPASPASSVTPGQMRPRAVTPTPSPAQLRLRQGARAPTLARPKDPDLARIWDAAFAQPFLPTAPGDMSSNPGTRGMQEDTQNMQQNGAVVDHLQKTGGNLDQYQRDLATQNAQAQMAAAGVNADNMASVGLGPKARQPFRPSGYSTGGDKAQPKVVSPGADGAPDISQQDVIDRIDGTPKGQKRPSFSAAKKAMEAERETTQAPLRRERAAQQEVDAAKQEKDTAKKEKQVGDLNGRRDAIMDRYKPTVIDEEIPNIDPKTGRVNVLQPTIRNRRVVNPELSPQDAKELDAIERELDKAQGKAARQPRGAKGHVKDKDGKKVGWLMQDGTQVDFDGNPLPD